MVQSPNWSLKPGVSVHFGPENRNCPFGQSLAQWSSAVAPPAAQLPSNAWPLGHESCVVHGEHEGPFFSVTAMICWSKNPAEHRHSPTRVALGAPPAAFPGHGWTFDCPSFQKPGFALHCESEVAPAGLGEVFAGQVDTAPPVL